VLALLVGPLALIAFSLTADLTPVYFDLVGRAQTFVHPAVMILAALAAVSVAERGRRRHIRSGKDHDAYGTTGGSRPTLRTVIGPPRTRLCARERAACLRGAARLRLPEHDDARGVRNGEFCGDPPRGELGQRRPLHADRVELLSERDGREHGADLSVAPQRRRSAGLSDRHTGVLDDHRSVTDAGRTRAVG